ncbi:NHLP bacteriocin system secretion protein [Francisella hispaniensis]|uniref:NHLP bacteriocin system secretion protein n=1 Tax=Francisella hispaniensis TaxID=622488 RepID=UPI001903DE30|nr:NHLP bacteriocin system secretion protein [Francisella hispaniensis]MBK2357787.1 NHLP bacteriocin system secretion protein [Francisella hispaniensis]
MNWSLFRKKSIDRIASPEQIDQNLKIISPKWWLLLISSFLLVLLFMIWGIFGILNTRVYGTGVIITKGGLQAIQTQFSGEISDVYIHLNSYVNKGDIVAKIILHDREIELKKLKDKLYTLKLKFDKLNDQLAIESQAIRNKYKILRIKDSFLLESKKKDYDLKEWEVSEFKKLLGNGAVSKLRYSDTMVEVNNLKASVDTIEKSLPLLDINEEIELSRKEVELVGYRKEYEFLKGQVEITQSHLEEDSLIRSKYTGYVTPYFHDQGDFLKAGDTIAMIQPADIETVAEVMFPADVGKKITVGSKAYISPSTASKEHYGMMEGVVSAVTKYPLSSDAMKNFFISDNLVRALSKIESPIGVEITLYRDKKTKSGYKWTNGAGPDMEISDGTLVSANVIIKKQAPVELLIPFLRKITGI